MSQNSQKSSEVRKSPVSSQKMVAAGKPGKSKTPKTKVAKPSAAKPLSNGLSNGVAGKKVEDQTAQMNLLTLQKTDSTVCSILATVPHVVLYEFKKSENVWVSHVIGVPTS